MADPETCILDPHRCVTREAIDSFRRELNGYAKTAAELRAEMNSKLDQLLTLRIAESEKFGALQEQVRSLAATVEKQGTSIEELRKATEKPKDATLLVMFEIGKLIVAVVIGYIFARFAK